MAYSSTKHHIGLNGEGYTISSRNGKRYYQKKRAPTFVNKFGGGDSSYRDASFWQFFVQTNWRNGAKQLKFDDAGKFWKSSDVDTTILEQLTLSKELISAGQLAPGVSANCIASWRADANASFGTGADGALTISSDTTDAPIDSACTGTNGTSTLTATNVSFATGQVILIHQSQGTGAGTYQKNEILSYTAGTITTKNPLNATYSTGAQVLVMKQYTTVTIDSTKVWTAKSWNGTVGGILAFMASSAVTVNGTIKNSGTAGGGPDATVAGATGGGFRGGQGDGSDPYSGEGTTGIALVRTNQNGSGGGGNTDSAGSGGGNGAAGSVGSGTTLGGTASGTASLSTMTFGGGGGGGSWAGESAAGGSGGGIIYIYGKTLTVTGSITVAGGNGGSGGTKRGGGGGAGGSILIRSQSATIGTALINASAGAGGSGVTAAGGAGAVGRIHIGYANAPSGTSTPTYDGAVDSDLMDTPASTTSTAYAGGDNGKIYSWDGATTWTEVYDTRRLTTFETGTDTSFKVGDDGDTEKACAQGFQVAAAVKMKGVSVYLKKSEGTPGDITVRIETDNTNVPSGTLVNASATGTISAFTSTDYAWYTVEFASNFSLAATTVYWIVLKTAAAATDNNYEWAGKTASGYASGTNALSTNGGSTWSAGTSDAYFRVLGNSTSVNCSLVTKVGGTKKLLFGTGADTSVDTGDARIISYDGTTWAINKTFATSTESVIHSLAEYNGDTKVYVGVGPQGKLYSTSDLSTYTISKDIDVPQNPGYIYSIKEYNSYLYAAGGSPELVPTQYYNGFMYYYDQTIWRSLYPFDFTVIKAMEFYDAYLFIGTYHGQLYVYDTSSLNPLFNFKDQYDYQQTVQCMKYFDDKLYIGLYPQTGTSDTNAGLWVFERHGMYNAHTVSGVTGYRCMEVVNGDLLVGTGTNGYVYRLSKTTYKTQGWYQSSYFDANLPSINKLYQSVTVKHDALVAGQSVVVYYRYKEADSWTTLGTSSTVGDIEEVLSFPAATYSKKITLKVELNTTTTTGTPKLTEVIMKYTLYPDRKFMWTMRLLAKKNIQLLDRTTDSRSATTIREALEDLMSTQSLYSFTDVDETSYTVLVNEVDQNSWVIQKDSDNEDEVVITLVEA